jgi:hypothetical protein
MRFQLKQNGLEIGMNEAHFGERHAFYTNPAKIYRPGSYHLSVNDEASVFNELFETPSSVPDTVYCPYERCTRSFTGKHRRGALHRHVRLKHIIRNSGQKEIRRLLCQVQGCGKDYMRQDALLKHQCSKHPELGLPPPTSRKQEPLAGPSQMEARQQLPNLDLADDERMVRFRSPHICSRT